MLELLGWGPQPGTLFLAMWGGLAFCNGPSNSESSDKSSRSGSVLSSWVTASGADGLPKLKLCGTGDVAGVGVSCVCESSLLLMMWFLLNIGFFFAVLELMAWGGSLISTVFAECSGVIFFFFNCRILDVALQAFQVTVFGD